MEEISSFVLVCQFAADKIQIEINYIFHSRNVMEKKVKQTNCINESLMGGSMPSH